MITSIVNTLALLTRPSGFKGWYLLKKHETFTKSKRNIKVETFLPPITIIKIFKL